MPGFPRVLYASVLLNAVLSLSACALENARWVSADEISGVVVDAGSGKPVADAIVAIRFERNNTGHSGPHCFRSMAVKTDAEGRFRFAPWKQENTRANYAMGEITGYKAGYSEPSRAVYVNQSSRSIGPIAFSDTIRFSKTEFRLQLPQFKGSDEDRIRELGRLIDNFTCRSQAQFDDTVLLVSVRNEIVSGPLAQQRLQNGYYTATTWIEAVIQLKAPR